MSNNLHRNYQHSSERMFAQDNNYRIHQRQGTQLSSGATSWEVKFVDEYLARLAYEKQQQVLGNDDSTRSVSSATDPAAEDFDMDEVSMPDSILLHRNDLSSSHITPSSTNSSLYRQNYSSMILEDVPYTPSSIPSRSGQRHHGHRRVASRVSFAEEALMYSNDCLYEEILRTWYNKDELASFKQDRKELIKVLKRHHFDLPVVEKTYGRKYCLRGYEPYFSLEGNKEIRRKRELVLSAVLQEQSKQRQMFGTISDHEVIARHCADASKWARDCGYRLGVQDSNEILKEYGQDIKPQDSYHRWELMIGKSIEDVVEQHHDENLREAMEYSLMEQRQRQLADSFLNGPLRDNLQRSLSDDLLRMQQEQLQILQAHQEQQMQNNPYRDAFPNRNTRQSQHEYEGRHGDLRSFQHEECHDKQQTHDYCPQEYWMRENDAQQSGMQAQHGQDRLLRLQELERQQVLRMQQMEMEQLRQQEQLRLMMEQQRRMEEHIRRQSQFNCGENVDEELESALKLVEALQFNQQQL